MSVMRIEVEGTSASVYRRQTIDGKTRVQKWSARKTVTFVVAVNGLIWTAAIYAAFSFL